MDTGGNAGLAPERRSWAMRPALVLPLAAALAGGAWLRLRGVAAMPLYGDEKHSLDLVGLPARELFRTYDLFGTHVPLPLLQRLCGLLSEPGVLALRLPALVFGLLGLALVYPIGKRLVGAPAAALAALAVALNPLHVYYSRFARPYAITACLALVLAGLVLRAEQRRWRGAATLAAVCAVAALLPWAHLSSAGSVLGLGLAAVGVAWARGGARAALRPLAAFSAAALACLLLYWPVREEVRLHLTMLPEELVDRPQGPFGIAVLLAGGVIAGGAWIAGLPVALALLWRAERAVAVLIAAAVLGPVACLLATMPNGMEYAYARYLLIAVPPVLLALAWLVLRLCGERSGLVLGSALVLAGYLGGPQSPLLSPEGPFANTYLALRRLEAFDAPFGMTPEVYRTIARDPDADRIIEAPLIDTRSVFLYRNYFRTHGKQVLIGLAQPEDLRLEGPYAFIGDPQVGRRTGADYLVVHHNLEQELQAYWGFVYTKVWPELDAYWDRAFMRQHRTFGLNENLTGMAEAFLRPLRAQLGEPVYEDGMVVVWRLKTGPRRGGRAQRAEDALDR
jgi:hypothetical protein